MSLGKTKTPKKIPQDNTNLVTAPSSPANKESKAEPPLQMERNSSIGVFLKDVLDDSAEEEQKQLENKLPKIQDSPEEEAPPIINKEIRQISISSEISDVGPLTPLSMEGGSSPDNVAVKGLIRPNPAKRTTSNQAENSATKKNTKLMRTKSITTNDELLAKENNQADDEIQHLSCKMQENNLLEVSSLKIEKPPRMSKEDRKSTIDVISEDLKSWINNI